MMILRYFRRYAAITLLDAAAFISALPPLFRRLIRCHYATAPLTPLATIRYADADAAIARRYTPCRRYALFFAGTCRTLHQYMNASRADAAPAALMLIFVAARRYAVLMRLSFFALPLYLYYAFMLLLRYALRCCCRYAHDGRRGKKKAVCVDFTRRQLIVCRHAALDASPQPPCCRSCLILCGCRYVDFFFTLLLPLLLMLLMLLTDIEC